MRLLSALTIIMPLVLVGCGESGPELHQVTGTVTYQGKALPFGSVMFIPQAKNAKAASSVIDATGHYQLETVAGTHYVQVQMAGRLRGQPALEGEGAKLDIPEVDWLIPKRYSYFQNSGLTATVAAEKENQIDFPLK